MRRPTTKMLAVTLKLLSAMLLCALPFVGSTPVADLKNNFMDCEGNDNGWGILRRCCNSDQLPNNCECFDISSSLTDFTNSLYHRPECPEDLEVEFLLYTSQNPIQATTIKTGKDVIEASPFDGSKKTFILTHGFTDFLPAPWGVQMKDKLLGKEDMNVILMNWQKGAEGPNYYQAVANTRSVGAMVGRLIQDLNSFGKADFKSFHLAGHSLGSHIMGYAGKEVYRLTNQLIGRITGLDPAGPAFERATEIVRIDSSDADFVDIIHSDAEPLHSSGFGIRKVVGHIDYFPNGGEHQPGCPEETYGIFSMLDFEAEQGGGACSHSRAIYFFLSSIETCTFNVLGAENSICPMGYHTDPSCRGVFYPNTTATNPFC